VIQAQVCFSRGTSPLAGVISAASMMRHAHPYTFQHGPATHAYISLRTPDMSVRIDGQPPVSAMSVDPGGGVRFDIDCPNGVPIEKLNQLLKVPYDPIELATQVLAGFETVDGIKSAAICTTIVMRFLEMVGLDLGTLPDRFPETLARKVASMPWARRA
jgi:hypothetical protein